MEIENLNTITMAPAESLERPAIAVRPSRIAGPSSSWRRQVVHLIVAGALALASYFFVSHYVFQSVEIVGSSMDPTLHHSDRYFLNRWVYRLHPPERSDIVVIRDPSDGTFVVKRIIGMPGESIHLRRGEVFINGAKLDEPYVRTVKSTFPGVQVPEELILCGKDQYFVLGDNRDNSYDSRMYGPVRRENILGAVIR